MLDVRNHFILFVVDDPSSCREFYRQHMDFEVEIDVGWYVVLKSGGARPFGIGFARQWFAAAK